MLISFFTIDAVNVVFNDCFDVFSGDGNGIVERKTHAFRPAAADDCFRQLSQRNVLGNKRGQLTVAQCFKRDAAGRAAHFKEGHRPHAKPGDASCAAVHYAFSFWRRRTSQEKAPFFSGLVDFEADGIPKSGNFLPLINEPWRVSTKNQRRVHFCQSAILKVAGRVADIELAVCMLCRCPGFPAPLWAFQAYCTECAKILFDGCINDSGLVFCAIHLFHLKPRIAKPVKFVNFNP